MNKLLKAPELDVSDWLNTPVPLQLSALRGKVVVLHAFQMLCPGCVMQGIPQASAIYELYKHEDVQVIGLHTVFEHHNVMDKEALTAFVQEYKLDFPVAIDQPSTDHSIPETMQKYQLQGTPSLVLIDQQGMIRLKHFGRLSDMQVGNAIGQLLAGVEETRGPLQSKTGEDGCNNNGCII